MMLFREATQHRILASTSVTIAQPSVQRHSIGTEDGTLDSEPKLETVRLLRAVL